MKKQYEKPEIEIEEFEIEENIAGIMSSGTTELDDPFYELLFE